MAATGQSWMVPGFPWPPLFEELREVFRLRPKVPLAEWAEANILLSPEYSNSTGPLMLFGWQRAIFSAITDPTIETVVIMSSTQVVKSLAIMCAIAYWIVEDPGPILLVEPKKDAARDFSKRRLMPMSRDCQILHGRISGSVHDGQNTIQSKDFPGGNLLIVSARTPVDLAQHTIRYLVCDEIDKYDEDVGGSVERQGEGDPIDLAWERAMTFGSRRKRVLACSPTVAGQSRIGKAFALSDQRRPWVPCPHCGTMQVLRFRDRSGYHVKWDSSLARELQPATARYHCVQCDKPWTEQERWTACNHQVEWRPDKPGGNVAGFWVNHMYVPPTWKTAASITQHFLNAKDDRQSLKTWINTVLAEEWVEEGVAPEKELLHARREPYPFGDTAVVPQRGLFLTAAVDVQESPPRLEVEIKAWGRGRENWSMGYWILQAFAENGQELPVSSRELWDRLAELLYRDWPHESGHHLPILAMCIDTGTNPKPVYEFARRPGHHQLHYGPQGIKLIAHRTVVPVKGMPDHLRIIASISKEDAARRRQGVRIVGIGTACAKAEIFDLLRHALPNPDESPSPGCYHFPLYDMVYFEGLTAEVKIVKPNGDVIYEQRGPRNEPVDLAVYNRGAAAIVGIDRMGEEHWRRFEQAVTPIGGTAPPHVPPPASVAPPQAAPTIQPGQFRPVRGGFRRD
jgi:phage terminase large subunit GpA-like protein